MEFIPLFILFGLVILYLYGKSKIKAFVTVGDIYISRTKADDPFSDDSDLYQVVEIKNGYVKYKNVKFDHTFSDTLDGFVERKTFHHHGQL